MSASEPDEMKQNEGQLEMLLVPIVTILTGGFVLLFGF